MDDVLGDLKNGKFRRTQVTATQDGTATQEVLKLNDMTNKGKIIVSDNMRFEDVPILSPNGDILVEKMNFEI